MRVNFSRLSFSEGELKGEDGIRVRVKKKDKGEMRARVK